MRVTEDDIAVAVVKIAAKQIDKVATFDILRNEIPGQVALSTEDRAPSETREGEELWEQLVRNIKSHSEVEGNFIYEGYLEHLPRTGYRATQLGIDKFC